MDLNKHLAVPKELLKNCTKILIIDDEHISEQTPRHSVITCFAGQCLLEAGNFKSTTETFHGYNSKYTILYFGQANF